MIVTLTLNPALDKTIYVEGLNLGQVNRIGTMVEDIGGKGINVSKVLKNFGIDSLATGFLGGSLKRVFLEEMEKLGLRNSFIEISGETRTNIKIVDPINKINTDINEEGPEITPGELEKLYRFFEAYIPGGNIIVMAGGVPKGLSLNIYRDLILKLGKNNRIILDADGDLLRLGIEALPYAIKPNIHELEGLVGRSLKNLDQVVGASRDLVKTGIELILVSMGAKGSLLVTGEKAFYTRGIDVEVESTVGAGDSMVAALVYGLIKDLSHEEVLAFANSCGTATVTLKGTEACSLKDVNKYMENSISNIEVF